jgi:hypothetical protein
MKKLVITLGAGFLALSLYAQGTVAFNTIGGGVNAPATNALTGARVAGTSFLAQLFYGAAGTQEEGLVPVSNPAAAFGTGSFAGYVNSASGGGNRTVPFPNNTPVLFQVRAWDASLGSDYATAYANWLADSTGTKVLGRSGIITVVVTEPPASPALLIGLQGWNLVPVPEPSVLALGILGGLGVLLLRRRK